MAINKRLIKSNEDAVPIVTTSFNSVLWTGTGSSQSITGVGFDPEFIITKNRDLTVGANVFDIIRDNFTLYLAGTSTENNFSNSIDISSANTDGFDLIGESSSFNSSGKRYVAWCWKAGGAAVTNTDGTITSQVSANTEAGFSVVTFTGVNLSSNSIGHGLGVTPSLVIMKGRNVATEWRVYSDQLNNDQFLKLNETAAATAIGINKNWTSTTISQQWAPASYSWVAYCFAEVAGFSKFGSYTGNGSTSGPTITTGFEPAFVMIKRTSSTGNWQMLDNKRSPSNPRRAFLLANANQAEVSSSLSDVDFNSNGFQIKTTWDEYNQSGDNYIYIAFANQF